jgi:hypothetical protein
MPGFDGTGPLGQGALTGRQAGYCADARRGHGIGRGLGRGFARGAGFGGRFAAAAPQGFQPQTDRETVEALMARVERLENEISGLRKHEANG